MGRDLAQADRNVEQLELKLRIMASDRFSSDRLTVAREELLMALASRDELKQQESQLDVRAPFSGRVIDLDPSLHLNRWVKTSTLLARLETPDHSEVMAYVGGDDWRRLVVGAQAWFVPEDIAWPRVAAEVEQIESVNVATLDSPYLASTWGGPISVAPRSGRELIPETSLYRVHLTSDALPPPRTARGVVRVEAEAIGTAQRLWNAMLTVLVRESGF
ncbi:hypothetical protein CCP2SC5_610015 [Azospirillaceae bacterium]